MYWFLALVLKDHILDGSFWPSFILCRAYTTSEKRTGLVILKQFDGRPSKNNPKLLVTEVTGHDDLLDFFSVYQTMNKAGGTHYHPEGALCWFSCNQYGDPTGSLIFARKVPIKSLMWDFNRKREFRTKNLKPKAKTLPEVLTHEPGTEDWEVRKPKLYQKSITKKGKKNARKKA